MSARRDELLTIYVISVCTDSRFRHCLFTSLTTTAAATVTASTTSKMRYSLSRFDLLPLEILSMIADLLRGSDLVGHVVLSEFRKDFRDYYYEGRGRDFWEPLLRANGLSTTAEENLEDKDWAELAVTCVKHVEVCQHPQCGMARLRENSELRYHSPPVNGA